MLRARRSRGWTPTIYFGELALLRGEAENSRSLRVKHAVRRRSRG